jgi:hypothetical protein
MKTKVTLRKYLSACALIATVVATDAFLGSHFIPAGSLVSSAEARVGRPLTAGSVAGVARRTTRRTIRRSTIYSATLPSGCATTSVNGITVWRCGGTYYQPYGGRYVVVYVN